MKSRNSKFAAGILIVLALFLLLVFGNLGLLAILIPVSLLLAYSLARFGAAKSGLTSGPRKG